MLRTLSKCELSKIRMTSGTRYLPSCVSIYGKFSIFGLIVLRFIFQKIRGRNCFYRKITGSSSVKLNLKSPRGLKTRTRTEWGGGRLWTVGGRRQGFGTEAGHGTHRNACTSSTQVTVNLKSHTCDDYDR